MMLSSYQKLIELVVKQNASSLVREIKTGLESEGLGDFTGWTVSVVDSGELFNTKDVEYRPGFENLMKAMPTKICNPDKNFEFQGVF